MVCEPEPLNVTVPVPPESVPESFQSPPTLNVPVSFLMAPLFVTVPTEVEEPEPISNAVLLMNDPPNTMPPLDEPRKPLLVAVPVRVRMPEVDVTVVLLPIKVVPTTCNELLRAESLPPPEVDNEPLTVTLPLKNRLFPLLLIDKL